MLMDDSASQSCELQTPEVQSPIDTLVGDWWVVHTKSRNEKALVSDLERLGIGHFLPLVRVRRKYGKRVMRVEIPLFPSYLFMCGGYEERSATLGTHRVANVIHVIEQLTLKQQLTDIHRLLTSECPSSDDWFRGG